MLVVKWILPILVIVASGMAEDDMEAEGLLHVDTLPDLQSLEEGSGFSESSPILPIPAQMNGIMERMQSTPEPRLEQEDGSGDDDTFAFGRSTKTEGEVSEHEEISNHDHHEHNSSAENEGTTPQVPVESFETNINATIILPIEAAETSKYSEEDGRIDDVHKSEESPEVVPKPDEAIAEEEQGGSEEVSSISKEREAIPTASSNFVDISEETSESDEIIPKRKETGGDSSPVNFVPAISDIETTPKSFEEPSDLEPATSDTELSSSTESPVSIHPPTVSTNTVLVEAVTEKKINNTVIVGTVASINMAKEVEVQESSYAKTTSMYITIGAIGACVLALIILITIRKTRNRRSMHIERDEDRDTEKALLGNGKDHSDGNSVIKNNEMTPLVFKENGHGEFEKSPTITPAKNINLTASDKNVEKDNVFKSLQERPEDDGNEGEEKKTERVAEAPEKLVVHTHIDLDSIPRRPVIINNNANTQQTDHT